MALHGLPPLVAGNQGSCNQQMEIVK
jgi:hypothetical protein